MASPVQSRALRAPSATSVPPCRSLGTHCKSLRVTLRIGELEDGPGSLDHEATWLLGHTQHIDFLELWESRGDLYVEAVLHVTCRYLHQDGPVATCRAHGFSGSAPRGMRRDPQPLQLGGDRFVVVEGRRPQIRSLPLPPRTLPILPSTGAPQVDNPCAAAPCRTADHVRKAACCRDLQVEIMCTRAQRRLEALVRSRRSPYLCKIERGGDYSLEVEMISACGYLETDGVSCSLHGRHRADGRTAKPDLCFEWPPKNRGLHPGCIFGPKRRRARLR